jgi:hypothetical protein
MVTGTVSRAQNALEIGLDDRINLAINTNADFNPISVEEIDGLGPHPSRDHQIYSFLRKKRRENPRLMTGIGNIHSLGDCPVLYREDGVSLTVTKMGRDDVAFFGDSDLHRLPPVTATATAAETTATESTSATPGNPSPSHTIERTNGRLGYISLDYFGSRGRVFCSLFFYFLNRVSWTTPAAPPSGAGSASQRTGSIKTWHILHLIITHMRKNLNKFL